MSFKTVKGYYKNSEENKNSKRNSELTFLNSNPRYSKNLFSNLIKDQEKYSKNKFTTFYKKKNSVISEKNTETQSKYSNRNSSDLNKIPNQVFINYNHLKKILKPPEKEKKKKKEENC